MKKSAAIVLFFVVWHLGSCKKYVQQQEQNALVSLITNGTWVVTRYLDNDSNITASFSGYVFQFQSDGVVTGTKSGASINGTWSGDVTTKTITSDFPSASFPLNELNAIWTITDSYPDSVAASTTLDSATNILNLHKQ
jgi:hypothetical protein